MSISRRTGLYVYLFLMILSALIIIIFYWIPIPNPPSIQQTTVPFHGGNKTTQTKSSTNTTVKEEITTMTLSFPNGTDKFLSGKKVSNPNNDTMSTLKARFENPEVMLLALSGLFGLLGASIAGITSLYKQKLWNSNPPLSELDKRRTYRYVIRPWLGSAVAIITYLALRAGLVNMGMPEGQQIELQPINQFGVSAISATVGLMTSQILTRLKDIFRTFMGITGGEVPEEEILVKLIAQDNISLAGGSTEVFARLSDNAAFQELKAEFTSTNVGNIQIAGVNPVDFNSAGVASISIVPLALGVSDVTVNVLQRTDNTILSSANKTITVVA
jgi:hypothetical protein